MRNVEYNAFSANVRDVSYNTGLATILFTSRYHEYSQNLTLFSYSLCLQYALLSLSDLFPSGELLILHGLAQLFTLRSSPDIHAHPIHSVAFCPS